jgi:hypothetical protein
MAEIDHHYKYPITKRGIPSQLITLSLASQLISPQLIAA